MRTDMSELLTRERDEALALVVDLQTGLVSALADITRLTAERDKAREDCGFQRGLKDSIKDELHTFIRLRQEALAEVERLKAIVDGPPTIAGWVACPDCGVEVPIGLTPLEVGTDEDGEQMVNIDLCLDDVWAHAWTHDDATD